MGTPINYCTIKTYKPVTPVELEFLIDFEYHRIQHCTRHSENFYSVYNFIKSCAHLVALMQNNPAAMVIIIKFFNTVVHLTCFSLICNSNCKNGGKAMSIKIQNVPVMAAINEILGTAIAII